MAGGTFRSLKGFNYRVWAAGALVSNIGTWMQRIAQDWLVLAELTPHRASAVGTVTALQFGPQLLLLPWTGRAADRLDRRKLIFATQAALGVLALGLGLLTISGRVRLWHVDVFAFLLGCVTAFDAPARQAFVSDLAGEELLSNAVALNASSFHLARMVGPAVAGALIASVGTGWAFLANAVSFAAVLISLSFLREHELFGRGPKPEALGGLPEGLAFIRGHREIRTALVMLLLIAIFGLNFPIFISTMAVSVFGLGAGHFGLLTACLAVGSVAGGLLAAQREQPDLRLLTLGAGAFGLACGAASLMPTAVLFGLALIPIGICTQTLTTSTNSLVQLGTHGPLRGRVLAILLAVLLGGNALGAPIIGWIADHGGPRAALGVAAAAGLAAAWVGRRAARG
jgi:MFS family permease